MIFSIIFFLFQVGIIVVIKQLLFTFISLDMNIIINTDSYLVGIMIFMYLKI